MNDEHNSQPYIYIYNIHIAELYSLQLFFFTRMIKIQLLKIAGTCV